MQMQLIECTLVVSHLPRASFHFFVTLVDNYAKNKRSCFSIVVLLTTVLNNH